MYNNDLLRIVHDDIVSTTKNKSNHYYTPFDCMSLFIDLFNRWVKAKYQTVAMRAIIIAMLFLLKYRKYDKSFIRQDDPNPKTQYLYDSLLVCITQNGLKRMECYRDIEKLLNTLKDFIENKGTLEGIPTEND